MTLIKGRNYFVSTKSVVLREKPNKKGEALNQLIYGDWLSYRGKTSGSWAQVFCRGNSGWIPKSSIQEERVLEINFLDIGIGDSCHIVTPQDEIILIDAGQTTNMSRFLSWRYDLRDRRVVGVDGVKKGDSKVKPPMEVDHVVISHPDKDHYYGFKSLFENKKLAFDRVYHNGILERPRSSQNEDADLHYYKSEDLGGYIKSGKKRFLWDVVHTSKEMHGLIKLHKTSRKDYLSTLRALTANNPKVTFKTLNHSVGTFEHFNGSNGVKIDILGPVTEKKEFKGKTKECLIRLKDEGKTKNGHSVIFRLEIGKLRVFLGGDLNTESEDYLMQFYAQTKLEASDLEHRISRIEEKGSTMSQAERQELFELKSDLGAIVAKTRKFFQVDVAKACHHGSHHFSESFLKSLNAIVTVVSSGDGDSFAHPRPDALGAFGKYGRGERPLIFSTEIGRSTKEFTHVKKYLDEIREFDERIKKAKTESERKKILKELEDRKDSNVATYGMITLRTNGEKVFLAQKLEAPRKESEKWDIHELIYNDELEEFQYVEKGGH